ncbi:MAG: SpoIIE family protein phosphatase [Nitrospira sp.]|nr:SpoIIE family protein phosphatase [Nitrospira sp.]
MLIVDDEPVTRTAMVARLTRLGYRVLQASDGKSGLELLRRERPDLTILDWMMPELDGLAFCDEVRRDPNILSSQILMMTRYDQPEQIAEGLARGADDFLSKAATSYEIIARVQAGIRTAMLIRRLEQVTEQIRRKQDLLERELQSAARYVESLLPAPGTLLPGIEMAHAYRPALTLGGDLFNVVRWDDHSLGLYLLDASGHGVSPALRSASFSTFLREDSLLNQVGSSDPGAILTEANRQFPLTEDGNYFTIIFVLLDIRSRTLFYATAGHHGAFLQRLSGEIIWLSQRSLPLGFDPTNVYQTAAVPLMKGDRLYVLSDGLYEIPSPDGELWGQPRLEATMREEGRRPVAEVLSHTIDAAARWHGQEHFPDDVAVMGIELGI